MKITPFLIVPTLCVLSYAASANDLFAEGPCKEAYEYHFLNRATAFGDWNGVKLLLDGGADANGSGYDKTLECLTYPGEFSSPLSLAVRDKNIEIVKLLLEAGADPNVVQGEAITPVSIARARGFTEILQLLLQHGGK